MTSPRRGPGRAIDRRAVLAAIPGVVGWAALGHAAPQAGHSAALAEPLAAFEIATGGRIGVYAQDLTTGAELTWRADERFVMCSTFKASLAACILARVDRGEDRLDERIAYGEADLLDYAPVARQHLAEGSLSVGELAQAIVELSDNTCANLLLRRIGGPAALTAFWRRHGDTTSRLDHEEPELNRSPPGDPHDTTTPAAMAQTLRRLALGDALTPASRATLAAWMVNCRTGAKRLRSGLPAAWTIGDKTGNNGKDAMSDIALAWTGGTPRIVAAVYTQGGTPTPLQIDQVFTQVGRLIGQTFS